MPFSVNPLMYCPLHCPTQAEELCVTSPREPDYEEQPSDFFFLLLRPLAFPQKPPTSSPPLTHPSLLSLV